MKIYKLKDNESDFIALKLVLAMVFLIGGALFLPTLITWAVILGDRIGSWL